MPLDWDSPAPFDIETQLVLADWLVHVKGERDPSRDDADTESDPVQFDEEDYEEFCDWAAARGVDVESVRESLAEAIGFSAWTSSV